VTCRQFRMHECKNVDVYLSCSSRPIIEDCSGIRFSQLPDTYVCLSSCSGKRKELTRFYSASQPHLHHHSPKPSPSKTPPTPPRIQPRNHPPQPKQQRHTSPLNLPTYGPKSTTSNGSKPHKVPTGASSHQKTWSPTMPGGRLFRAGRAGSLRIS
jgi:Tubulin binding cofactor C